MVDVWHMCLTVLRDDVALQAHVIGMLQKDTYRPISQCITSNPCLPVKIYSLRRLDIWRVLLVLTPWMLTYLLIPDRNPGLELPDKPVGNHEVHLLGPMIEFTVFGNQYKAHLNFDPQLGHYLVQPLILGMERYANAEAVFTAWKKTLTKRLAMHRNRKNFCKQHKHVSRRDILTFPLGRVGKNLEFS